MSPEESKAYQKKWKADNKTYSLNYNRMRNCGATPEWVQQKLEEQGNCCAICGRDFVRTPCVDHCHKTGKLRALLCNFCNLRVGYHENRAITDKVEAYLRLHSSPPLTADASLERPRVSQPHSCNEITGQTC